mmetsp:Transcript_28786/g.42408  ORF Transcript_28786/g.42408 Transcript_28786/m.42408 type:complete len:106 (-) Transcript_28786:695-1012(-)
MMKSTTVIAMAAFMMACMSAQAFAPTANARTYHSMKRTSFVTPQGATVRRTSPLKMATEEEIKAAQAAAAQQTGAVFDDEVGLCMISPFLRHFSFRLSVGKNHTA